MGKKRKTSLQINTVLTKWSYPHVIAILDFLIDRPSTFKKLRMVQRLRGVFFLWLLSFWTSKKKVTRFSEAKQKYIRGNAPCFSEAK